VGGRVSASAAEKTIEWGRLGGAESKYVLAGLEEKPACSAGLTGVPGREEHAETE
jgi:hypothetical protein